MDYGWLQTYAKRPVISETIVSAAWSPTMGGVSGPGVEPSWLGTASIDDEMGAKIGGDTMDASVVANSVVGSWLTPTMRAMLDGKTLEV